MKRGLTPYSQAGMQCPLPVQISAQRRAVAGPSPVRIRSMTPDATASASDTSSPAGPGIGQTRTHSPHFVQASRMPARRISSAAKKS